MNLWTPFWIGRRLLGRSHEVRSSVGAHAIDWTVLWLEVWIDQVVLVHVVVAGHHVGVACVQEALESLILDQLLAIVVCSLLIESCEVSNEVVHELRHEVRLESKTWVA